MKIKPVGERVLVKALPEPEGQIIRPETVKKEFNKVEVVGIGSDVFKGEEEFKVGDKVLFHSRAGFMVEGMPDYFLVWSSDISGVILGA